MDPRLYMLAGTFALLVIALIATAISFVRSMRRRHPEPAGPLALPAEWSELPPVEDRAFDTNLEGLELQVSADTPSAALLMPLRTGAWVPPESPAPAETLPEVALDSRIASYVSAENPAESAELPASDEANVPFPETASDREIVPVNEVAPDANATLPEAISLPAAPVASDAAPAAIAEASVAALPVALLTLPEVIRASEPTPAAEPAAAPEPELAPDFAVAIEPEPAPAPEPAPEPAPAPEPTVAIEPEPAPEPQPSAVLQPQPEPALEPVPEPAPEQAPAAMPDPVASPVPEVAPRPAQAYETPVRDVDEPGPAPVWLPPEVTPVPLQPVTVAAERPAAPETFWESILREQQDLPTIVTAQAALDGSNPDAATLAASIAPPSSAGSAVSERPAVVVHEPPQPPHVIVAPLNSDARPARPRPRAVVRVADPDAPRVSTTERLAPLASQETVAPAEGLQAPSEIVMAAPVEMWFGEHRVGVKEGTKTYAQFRRYADTLFDDLRAARSGA